MAASGMAARAWRREKLEVGWGCTLSKPPQWHTSSNKAEPLKFPQIVSSAENQVLIYICLWGGDTLIKPPWWWRWRRLWSWWWICYFDICPFNWVHILFCISYLYCVLPVTHNTYCEFCMLGYFNFRPNIIPFREIIHILQRLPT